MDSRGRGALANISVPIYFVIHSSAASPALNGLNGGIIDNRFTEPRRLFGDDINYSRAHDELQPAALKTA
jgi:hypothetical protein